jgi:hypothetical protein
MKSSGADVIEFYLFKLRSRFFLRRRGSATAAATAAAKTAGNAGDDERHRGRDEKKRELENGNYVKLVQNPVEFFSTEYWFNI